MNKPAYCLILIFILTISCNTRQETADQINYAELPDLETELVLEIGETGEFIPGQLRDLAVTRDGTILVSDWGRVTIDQFSPDGNHTETIAKEGGGPGELTGWFSMMNTGSDTILVSHQGGKKDLFAQNSAGLFELSKTVMSDGITDRPATVLAYKTGGEYYATTGYIVRDVAREISNPKDYRQAPLITMKLDGTVQADSLHLLGSPMMHLTQLNGGFTINAIPYRYTDRFLPLSNGGYIIARPDSNAFFRYSANHELEQRIPLHAESRPVEKTDLDYALKDVQQQVISQIERRVHDYKPPFLNAWISKNGIWLHTDTWEGGKEMVLFDTETGPVGKFLLSDVDEIKHITGNRIYTVHKNPDLGDSIRIYEIQE